MLGFHNVAVEALMGGLRGFSNKKMYGHLAGKRSGHINEVSIRSVPLMCEYEYW